MTPWIHANMRIWNQKRTLTSVIISGTSTRGPIMAVKAYESLHQFETAGVVGTDEKDFLLHRN